MDHHMKTLAGGIVKNWEYEIKQVEFFEWSLVLTSGKSHSNTNRQGGIWREIKGGSAIGIAIGKGICRARGTLPQRSGQSASVGKWGLWRKVGSAEKVGQWTRAVVQAIYPSLLTIR
jgi:hypothetical protein